MAHTSCPNGHDMWDGDGKPVVLTVRTKFVKEFTKKNPNVKLDDDDHSMYLDIFDVPYEVIGEDLECWYCDECKGLKVFCDISTYLFKYYDKLPNVKYDDIKAWEEYIAIRFNELDDFQEVSKGKTPIEALKAYSFKFKYKVSKDKKIIYAVDGNNKIHHGWYRSLYFETSPDFNYSFGEGSKAIYPFEHYKGKLDLNPQIGWYAYGHDKVIQIDRIVKPKKEYIGHYYNDSSCKPVVIKHSEIIEITDVLDKSEAEFYMQNDSKK